MQDETTPHDAGAMPPASDGSRGAVWNTPSLAMPQPNIDVLLWCDQGVVIGYHNGCGDWRLAPIEEEPRPWRLAATNVTHWMPLPEPPSADAIQQGQTLTDAERAAIAWCVGMAERTATECDEELEALRRLLERTK